MPSNWFSRKSEEPEIPVELQGKTPAQILQAMKDAEARETALQAKLDEQAGLNTELERLRIQVQELEARPPLRNEVPPTQPQNNGPTSVLVDEDKAFDERMAPLANMTFNTAAIGARMLAMEQLRDMAVADGFNHIAFFNKFRVDIEHLMAQIPPVQRGHPDTWLNIYNLVKGRHSSELIAASKKGENAFFTEPTSGTPPPPPVDRGDTLTKVESDIAKKFGLSDEAYLTQKKGIKTNVAAVA